MKIRTLPVYSKLADERDIPEELRGKLPLGWRLSQHQVDTYRALTQGDADVIFNTAMTGDGKSLAAYLPVLVNDQSVLAMYPTNELIRDQSEQLTSAEGYLARFHRQDINCAQMYSESLAELQSARGIERRGDMILNLRQNNDVVLTNPDIFHYVMYLCYLRHKGDTADKYFAKIKDFTNLFLFDEFHVFQAPQVAAVVNALLLIHFTTAKSQRRKYLFLSATPNDQLLGALRSAGLRCDEVNHHIDTPYLHIETADPTRWRKIVNQSDIHFELGYADEWVRAHVADVIVPLFEEHPHSKGAIIVNSVATAKQITWFLRKYFVTPEIITRLGKVLSIGENTGFSSNTERERSKKSDLIIGTSTIDVGVDFKINLLIFESVDAGTFLQRLGRLGRHDGYQQDGLTYQFEKFAAYALVPDFILDRLFKVWNGKLRFTDGQATNRELLRDGITEVYPPVNSFEQYGTRWGSLQAGYIVKQLESAPIKQAYEAVREPLSHAYVQAFRLKSIDDPIKRIHSIQKHRPQLFDEIRSFRGGGAFDCGVIDESELDGADRLKTYNLFSLLANTDARLIDKAEFFRAVKYYDAPESRFNKERLVLCFCMTHWLDERENYAIQLQHDLGDCQHNWFGQARPLDGIVIDMPRHSDISQINRQLEGRQYVCLLVKGIEPKVLKARLHLPRLFGVLPFRSLGIETGSIVFGKEALLLESVLRGWRGEPLPQELCFIV